ncbi:MAG TPA: glycosyltransferase family 39 protein [Candidatus Goldiibacteriota bacterium]|nr:glycosyltransferase family 39 protein [Candidatus Goldiibacteriota bacterium]
MGNNGFFKYINLYFAVFYFIIFQYFLFIPDSIKIQGYSFYIAFIAFACFGLSVFVHIKKLSWLYSFSFLPVMIGAVLSLFLTQNMFSLVLYLTSFLIVFFVFIPGKKDVSVTGNTNYGIWLVFVVVAFVLAAAPYLIDKYLSHMDSFVEWYMPSRLQGVGVNDVVAGLPYKTNMVFLPAVILILFVLLGNYLFNLTGIKNRFIVVSFLVLVAFLAKPTVANLSGHGPKVMEIKMESYTNNTYYSAAKINKDNIIQFINEYDSINQKSRQSVHLGGHPPLPVLMYRVIGGIVNFNTYIVSWIYSFLTALSVIPIFLLTKKVTGNRHAAIFSAMIYGLTPNSAILSVAGTDGIIVTIVAFAVLYNFKFAESGRNLTLFSSGFIWGLASGFTFGIWFVIPFAFVAMIMEILQVSKDKNKSLIIKKIVSAGLVFAAGIVSYHAVFFIMFPGFNYINSFVFAKKVVTDVASRPALLWSWANFIHWSEYITAAVLSMYIYALFKKTDIKLYAYKHLSIYIVLTTFLSIMGRGEQHRQWMYLIVFVMPLAASALVKIVDGKQKFCFNQAALFAVLCFLQTCIIEILVTDSH